MAKIIPAILCSSEEEYKSRLMKAEHISDLIQVDIVDGKFAKNTTIDAKVVKKYPTTSYLEIQLMVVEPQKVIVDYLSIDFVSRIVVPLETDADIRQLIYSVKSRNKQVGISLNLQTSVDVATGYFDEIDFLLLLAVNPGFSGQKFSSGIITKISEVKKFDKSMPIEIDGGVNIKNCSRLARSGVDFLTVGSALFGAEDFFVAYEKLAKLASMTS